jgi:hypothetical protein
LLVDKLQRDSGIEKIRRFIYMQQMMAISRSSTAQERT